MLGQFCGALLCLVEVVVGGLDATILVRVLSGLHSVEVLRPLNLLLVALALLLQLGQFVTGVVVLLAQRVATVGFLGAVALAGEDLGLAAADLLTGGCDLGAQVVVRAVLLIEQEAGVVNFFLEPGDSHDVRVVPGLEVIVLQQFLVLQVSVLGLNGVKLVTQSQVVLVPLFDLEDLGLELRDEQVFLVGGQMHAIVILE